MRVLSWNLYHGRDFPPDRALFTLRSRLLRVTERNETHVQVNRSLCREFTGWLADQQWDVALLQEAPPLWFRAFQRRTGSAGARAFTSRNVVPPLQRFAAFVNPDLIASWEGGSNQLLVREPGRILEQRSMTLTLRPERRTMLWARVELPDGARVCFANLHASAGLPEKASAELPAAAASAVEWSEGDPLVFGGDLNLRPAQHPAAIRGAARALRPGRADWTARYRPPARPRPRGRGAHAAACARGARAAGAGRAAPAAFRPRARGGAVGGGVARGSEVR